MAAPSSPLPSRRCAGSFIWGLMLLVCLEVSLILLCRVSCCIWLVLALRRAFMRVVGGSSAHQEREEAAEQMMYS